ncbi:MAG: hypothetical protein LBC76_07785, partial [Treponema sp.]|nr:hypothetical protein [Treponema sp.]
MPSLNALGEFKSSFNDIANEKSDVEARNQPFNDLDLPTQEADPMEISLRERSSEPDKSSAETDGVGFDIDSFLNNLPADVSPPPLDEPPSVDELLQNTAPPSSADPPSLDDLFASMGDMSGGDTASSDALNDDLKIYKSDDLGLEDSGSSTPASEDFSIPDGLFPSETEMASEDSPSGDFGSGDFGTDDAGTDDSDPGAIDLGGEDRDGNFAVEPETEGLPDAADEETNIDETSEAVPDSIDLGDTSLSDDDLSESIDLGGESSEPIKAEESDTSPADDVLPDFDFPDTDLSGMGTDLPQEDSGIDTNDEIDLTPGISEDTGTENGDTGSDFDASLPDVDFSNVGADTGQEDSGLDTGGETPSSSDAEALDTGGDILGDLGTEFSSDSIDLDTGGSDNSSGFDSSGIDTSGGDFSASDEFDIPGLEEIFDKSKTSAKEKPAPKKGRFGRKKKPAETEEEKGTEDIGEIQLTQEELDSILETLAFYPLNLRIACEEIIAEQVIQPQQLAKLIRFLVNGANVRETAKLVEEITGKPVVIPKSFEKMTGAAFEAEQASFAYIFVHN